MTLVLSGGRVIDPASSFDAIADVVTSDGVVTAVGPGLAGKYPDAEIVDCTRHLVVTPGFIDLHVHVMKGLGDFCVGADEVGVGDGRADRGRRRHVGRRHVRPRPHAR